MAASCPIPPPCRAPVYPAGSITIWRSSQERAIRYASRWRAGRMGPRAPVKR